jgi:POT family proton-dependent oligopeptide transporter
MATQAVNRSSDSLAIRDTEVTVVKTDAEKPSKSIIPASYSLGLGDEDPTEEDLHGPTALRRVSAPIPWSVYTVAFVELCERFSYYGTQVLCMQNITMRRDNNF